MKCHLFALPVVYHQIMIPINSPGRFYQGSEKQINAAVERVLDSGWLLLGPENEALEEELNNYLGIDHTVLVGNGTDALEIALRSIGVRRGTQVLTVANAGAYASTAITQVGGNPVYVDVQENTLQMDTEDLSNVIANLPERPSAIIATHLYGHAAPIREICKIADSASIPVIEDCAQSMGASVNGRKLGSFGDMATTSFYPTKNLGGIGDGGAIFTSNESFAGRARSLRQYGWKSRYHADLRGGRNSRLDEIQAAVIRLGLKRLDDRNKVRQEIHASYAEAASAASSRFPHTPSESFVAHLAVMTATKRDDLRAFLKDRGIGTDIHYPTPDYRQEAFREFSNRSLPVTETISEKILTIPLFPEMTQVEIETVVEALSGIASD